MRNLILVLPAVLCVAFAANIVKDNEAPEKLRRMKLAEASYATGCYAEAVAACSRMSELFKSGCYDDADANCPKRAKAFRDWLEAGPNK